MICRGPTESVGKGKKPLHHFCINLYYNRIKVNLAPVLAYFNPIHSYLMFPMAFDQPCMVLVNSERSSQKWDCEIILMLDLTRNVCWSFHPLSENTLTVPIPFCESNFWSHQKMATCQSASIYFKKGNLKCISFFYHLVMLFLELILPFMYSFAYKLNAHCCFQAVVHKNIDFTRVLCFIAPCSS